MLECFHTFGKIVEQGRPAAGLVSEVRIKPLTGSAVGALLFLNALFDIKHLILKTQRLTQRPNIGLHKGYLPRITSNLIQIMCVIFSEIDNPDLRK